MKFTHLNYKSFKHPTRSPRFTSTPTISPYTLSPTHPSFTLIAAIMMEAKNNVKQLMDPEVFEAGWKEGAEMGLDKIVTYAMEG